MYYIARAQAAEAAKETVGKSEAYRARGLCYMTLRRMDDSIADLTQARAPFRRLLSQFRGRAAIVVSIPRQCAAPRSPCTFLFSLLLASQAAKLRSGDAPVHVTLGQARPPPRCSVPSSATRLPCPLPPSLRPLRVSCPATSLPPQSLLLAGRLNEAYEVLQKAVELDRCATRSHPPIPTHCALLFAKVFSFPYHPFLLLLLLFVVSSRSHPDVANNLGLAYLGLGKIDREVTERSLARPPFRRNRQPRLYCP